MRCPVCNEDLRTSDLGEYGFVVIDTCPSCQGIWCDRNELDKLDDSVWTNVEQLHFDEVSAKRQVDCPRCSKPLQAISPTDARELVIDRCSTCAGFWLDHGELEQLRELASSADDQTLQDMQWGGRPPDWSHLRWAAHLIKKGIGL